MEQTVYADVLFLINFSMDLLSLYICARVLHKRIRTLPLTLSAALGGLYAVAALFLDLPFFADAAVSYLMCLTAFCGRGFSFSSSLISWFVFFVSQALLGGFMTSAMNILGRTSLAEGVMLSDNDLPLWIFVILAPISSLFTYLGGRILKRGADENTVGIKIENEGNSLSLTALVDSGNLLTDPISGRPVVVVGYESVRNFLPPEIRRVTESGEIDASALSFSSARRIRMIPATGIGEKSILVGFVPDKIILQKGKRERAVSAVIATEKRVRGFGGCDAIISTTLVKG